MEEYCFYEVEFRNIEGDNKWTIVKAPIDMDYSEIEDRMMNDTEIAQVFSVSETSNEDYGRDFTDYEN